MTLLTVVYFDCDIFLKHGTGYESRLYFGQPFTKSKKQLRWIVYK